MPSSPGVSIPTTGLLTLIGYTTDGIADPECFAIDAAGAIVTSCNYNDSTVTQYAIDQTTGALTLTGNPTEVPFPFAIALSA